MARPKSKDKRDSIIAAATEAIAEQGLGVSTCKIAQLAGVAEGSLFTYFATKEILFNELFVELKLKERENVMHDYPFHASLQNRARHIWDKYVRLGITYPSRYKVITQLSVSHHISEQTRRECEGYEAVNAMMKEVLAGGSLKDQPPEFGVALLISLMNMTIEFIIQHPSEADTFWDAGFTAFWNAVTHT
ncbi:MAG TPA: TetR/AcrR family transcriptional regulator [Ktedonobacteraceae bacterium]|jgi:AcrR family transcriptional regulator|nr:TetR/AcrR family transcriptional regulator [Ktedonobacteraceae bacterium]